MPVQTRTQTKTLQAKSTSLNKDPATTVPIQTRSQTKTLQAKSEPIEIVQAPVRKSERIKRRRYVPEVDEFTQIRNQRLAEFQDRPVVQLFKQFIHEKNSGKVFGYEYIYILGILFDLQNNNRYEYQIMVDNATIKRVVPLYKRLIHAIDPDNGKVTITKRPDIKLPGKEVCYDVVFEYNLYSPNLDDSFLDDEYLFPEWETVKHQGLSLYELWW